MTATIINITKSPKPLEFLYLRIQQHNYYTSNSKAIDSLVRFYVNIKNSMSTFFEMGSKLLIFASLAAIINFKVVDQNSEERAPFMVLNAT